MSGGKKRLALVARVLVQEASYILFDEAGAHLDSANQHRVLSVLCGLLGEG